METLVINKEIRIFNPGVKALVCRQCGKDFYGHHSSTHCECCTTDPETKRQRFLSFEHWWLYTIDGPKLTSEQKSSIQSKI